MGEITLPRHAFLWCVSAIYMFAFASLYVQIPGLYGNEGVLPARWRLRYVGKPVLEQMAAAPTLLWLGPRLALDTQQGLELLALAGTALSLGATAFPQLSHSAVYLTLWLLYLSLYQVGQVFLYFQWDNLLLEVGFLAVLIAPLKLPWSQRGRFHDGMTFWLARWLLFRLMFASGVVKLTSRCPTWWGLTALTYHYETQCIPTSLAWFAHQLPVWLHKLSVVCTFLIEIAVPMLFFSPLRRHRLTAFYLQVLLQVCIILSGNYNFFNLLTVALCLSLLDDAHINFLLRRPSQDQEPHSQTWLQTVLRCVCVLVEVCVYALLAYWMVLYFDLQVDWDKKSISSKTAFTYHQFNAFLKAVMVPSIWMGVFSLTWEIISAMFRCACVSGVWRRLWSTLQWGVMAAAAVSMFAISLVPFTFIEYEANSSLWPGVRKVFEATDRFQLVNSYGLFRRMTGVGGRPEVVIEGSMDRNTWTEIEFMYKPGNVSAAPPLVMPHQPRLDWQMWFAALGPQEQSPWFTSLVYRLLQGKRDVIRLIQADESRYPFSQQPPAFIRAHRYKYWFTEPTEDGTHPQRWWRRVYVEEFYPIVHLGDSFLERMLSQYGLKDKAAVRRGSEAVLPWLLACVRERVHGLDALRLLWSLIGSAVLICLLRSLTRSHTRTHTYTHTHARDKLDRTATEPEHNATATKPAAGDTQLHPDQEEEEERQEEEEKGERDEEKRERGEDELEEEQEEDDDYDKEEEKEEEADTSSDDLRKRK